MQWTAVASPQAAEDLDAVVDDPWARLVEEREARTRAVLASVGAVVVEAESAAEPSVVASRGDARREGGGAEGVDGGRGAEAGWGGAHLSGAPQEGEEAVAAEVAALRERAERLQALLQRAPF